jgi:hypothetical protein
MTCGRSRLNANRSHNHHEHGTDIDGDAECDRLLASAQRDRPWHEA